jgi:hypothetical protein
MKLIAGGRFLFWAAVLLVAIANLIGDSIAGGI